MQSTATYLHFVLLNLSIPLRIPPSNVPHTSDGYLPTLRVELTAPNGLCLRNKKVSFNTYSIQIKSSTQWVENIGILEQEIFLQLLKNSAQWVLAPSLDICASTYISHPVWFYRKNRHFQGEITIFLNRVNFYPKNSNRGSSVNAHRLYLYSIPTQIQGG